MITKYVIYQESPRIDKKVFVKESKTSVMSENGVWHIKNTWYQTMFSSYKEAHAELLMRINSRINWIEENLKKKREHLDVIKSLAP